MLKCTGKMNTTDLQTSLSPNSVWSSNYLAKKEFFSFYIISALQISYCKTAHAKKKNPTKKTNQKRMGDVTEFARHIAHLKKWAVSLSLPRSAPRPICHWAEMGSTPQALPVAEVPPCPAPWGTMCPAWILVSWWDPGAMSAATSSSAVMTFAKPTAPTCFLQQIFRLSASLGSKHIDIKWLTRPHPSQEETTFPYLTPRFGIHFYLVSSLGTWRPLAGQLRSTVETVSLA